MKLKFIGDVDNLKEGLSIIADTLHFSITEDGHEITVAKSLDGKLHVSYNKIEYAEPAHFFRGVGLILEHKNEASFNICETPQFKTNGYMLDVCQGNSALTLPKMKELLCRMAVMGLNTFYLYMEDTFEVPEEPYFGYMRGRYTQAELREIDDFAFALGITVIPCIQTLAHLLDALKWYPYADFKDDDDTLLVGDERTYIFLEHVLRAIRAPFRSKRIHIGMDEAWKLGQGVYLLRNGHRPTYKIMNEHLMRVLDICKKVGIDAMIWSDMYLKAATPSENPDDSYYALTEEMPEEIISSAPRELDYVYWDYSHHNVNEYETIIERHRKFTKRLIFAGGIWNWNSFTVDYDKTFITSKAALKACKNKGVQEVFVTTWGDGGAECNIFATLLGMQLYAEYGFSETVSTERLRARFNACTGCNYDDFREMTYLDNLYGQELKNSYSFTNSSRWLMWQDILAGLFDKNIEGLGMGAQYENVYKNMVGAISRNGDYDFIFEFLSKTADVLRVKAELGIRIKTAYDKNDKLSLKQIVQNDLSALRERVTALREYHRKIWFETYKPLGWEVLDVRYGGLLMRIDTAILRLTDYVSGKVEVLDEVEAERLSYDGKKGLVENNFYCKMPSASRLSFSLGF